MVIRAGTQDRNLEEGTETEIMEERPTPPRTPTATIHEDSVPQTRPEDNLTETVFSLMSLS